MAEYSSMFNSERVDLKTAIPLAAPLVIQLEPSGFCNLKCSFCPVNDKSVQKWFHKSYMTKDLFSEFVRQCGEFPKQISVLRLIGNGEPLLNRDIAEFVRIAKDSGAFDRVEITTNGTLLTERLSDALIDAGLNTLKVSLEAIDNESFACISGVRISVDELYEKLAYFYLHRGNCRLYIKTTDLAVQGEGARKRFLTDYGKIADYIFVETVTDIWPEYSKKLGQKPRYERVIAEKNPVCIQPFDLLNIFADGVVSPCCADWKRCLALGSITQTPLTELWRGEKLFALRSALLKGTEPAPCNQCAFPAVSQSDYIDEAKADILERIAGEKEYA